MAFSHRFLSKSFDDINIGVENQNKTKEKEWIDYSTIERENQRLENENINKMQIKNSDMGSIKGEDSFDTISIIYPKDELEDLNKQCYNIQSILLDASYSKDIDLNEINRENFTRCKVIYF